jgi:hypothetical protein
LLYQPNEGASKMRILDHHGNEIPESAILAGREQAAQIHRDILNDIEAGNGGFASHITFEDIEEIKEAHRRDIDAILAGERDYTWGMWQTFNEIATGECVALLPK